MARLTRHMTHAAVVKWAHMYGYLDIQALVGISKHPGGLRFTRRLVDRLGIDHSSRLLYIGAGNGAAPAGIAERVQCEVFAVDSDARMLEAAVHYRTPGLTLLAGDAESLPFPSDSFDGVLSESVTAFTAVTRSLGEYFRVLKRGGSVGLNEMTWLEEPPGEMVDYAAELLDGLAPRTREGWIHALAAAGFSGIDADTGALTKLEMVTGELQMLDRRALGIARRFLSLLVHDPLFRTSLRHLAGSAARMPRGFLKRFGYGLYVAQKP